VQQFLVGWTGWDSTPVSDAKANIDAIDKSLAGLVSNGQSDLAAAAVKRLTAEYGKGGRDTSKFTSQLNDYNDALGDSAFEQGLAADSMGLFGAQAQSVQTKLNAQKQSADGLRQSIQALNDVQRAGLGGMIGFEASIDAASKAARDNAGALSMSNGVLSLGSEKARNAATALQDLADKTDSAAASARESGSSWETANGIYTRGRAALVKSAQAMGLTKTEASALADQILKIPNKTTTFKMDKEDAQHDLTAFNAAVKASPDTKSVTLKALSASGEQVLEQFGLKVKRLPNGSVTVSTKGGALSAISNIAAALRGLNGRSATTWVYHNVRTTYSTAGSVSGGKSVHGMVGATGGLFTGAGFRHRGYSDGGLVGGHGTETSDSIFAPWLSKNEFVVNARRTRQYLPLLKALNSGKLALGSLGGSGGGTAAAGMEAGRGLAAGMTGATGLVNSAARTMASAVEAGIRDELEISSPSKKTKALAADTGKGFIVGLTGTQAKIKSVSADLVKDIKTAFSGKKESSLVRMVDQDTKKLLSMAAKRDKVAATIAAAKAYASDVTKNAREGAGLSNLGLEPEQVSAGSIKAGLAGKLAQIKQFTKYIDILAKKGLSKGLLRQILDMGPDAGYAYASALVGADKGTFNSINSLQSQLDKSTTTLGRDGADKLYDSGKNASKGFLTGLLSQEGDLEKAMEKLAKSMQKSLRKALGINSPATKMIPDGINTARGVAVGVIAGLPHVDRAMETMAGRMAGRAAVAGRPAVAGAGGGVVYNVQVDVHDAMDPVAVGRELQRVLVQFGRAQGTSVSLKLGG
jgi:chorismate mutase